MTLKLNLKDVIRPGDLLIINNHVDSEKEWYRCGIDWYGEICLESNEAIIPWNNLKQSDFYTFRKVENAKNEFMSLRKYDVNKFFSFKCNTLRYAEDCELIFTADDIEVTENGDLTLKGRSSYELLRSDDYLVMKHNETGKVYKAHFSHYDRNTGEVFFFSDGQSSFTTCGDLNVYHEDEITTSFVSYATRHFISNVRGI